MADIICAGTLKGAPIKRWYDLGDTATTGETWSAGDPLVLDDSLNGVRAAAASDGEGSAHWLVSAVAAGIIGFAASDVKGDTSGLAYAQVVPTGVSAGAVPSLVIPQASGAVPINSGTGRSRVPVWVAHPDQRFLIRLMGGSATTGTALTIDDAYVGTQAGLAYNATQGWYALNGSSYPIFVVDSVSRTDPYFNVSSTGCHVYVRILPSYAQFLNGVLYA